MTALRRAGTWFARGGWWLPVHVLSFGLLSPVLFAQAATRSRRAVHAATAVLYLVALVTAITLVGTAPEDAAGERQGLAPDLGGALILLVLLGGLAHLLVVRHQVYGAAAPAPRPSAHDGGSHADPAIGAALAARSRRAEARRLVREDPLLAREVGVGRPDLPRTYDDGGLVDLNAVPAPVLATVLGIDASLAGRIVAARQAAGRFGAVDEMLVHVDVPIGLWDHVRDRAIVLG